MFDAFGKPAATFTEKDLACSVRDGFSGSLYSLYDQSGGGVEIWTITLNDDYSIFCWSGDAKLKDKFIETLRDRYRMGTLKDLQIKHRRIGEQLMGL